MIMPVLFFFVSPFRRSLSGFDAQVGSVRDRGEVVVSVDMLERDHKNKPFFGIDIIGRR